MARHRTQRAVELDDPYYLRAIQLMEQEKWEEAAAGLRHAIAHNPGNGASWYDLGMLMEAFGNPEDALECFAMAERLDPRRRQARESARRLRQELEQTRSLRDQAFRSSLAW
jgi:cytochrome c-type biogenesis protein CcmH/NrfG